MMRILAIETGVEPGYENRLQEAAARAGWKVRRVQSMPGDNFVSGDGDSLPQALLDDPRVWLHGSIQAAKRAQRVTRWQVHAPWADLCCSSYYPLLQERIFQRDHLFTTVAGVNADRAALFASHLVKDDALFFRPDGNDKAFTGGCITREDFDSGYALMTFYDPPPTLGVVVARPQRILSEARFLVVDGVLVTGSLYRTGGQAIRLEAHAELLQTARDHLAFCLAQGFNPAPSWVLDLAETTDGWSIIEVGATACCGLYQCDMDAFIKALSASLPD